MADFRIKDNSDKVLKALQKQIGLGLEAIGAKAQRRKNMPCVIVLWTFGKEDLKLVKI